jgi:hypothetical protein
MASDDDVQEAILEVLCNEFHSQAGITNLSAKSIIDGLDSEGYAENDVQYNLNRLDQQHAIDYEGSIGGGGLVKLNYLGIESYEQLSGESIIPDQHQMKVLQELDSEKRKNPQSGGLSRDELLDRTSLSEKELDKAVWFMKEKGQVDAVTHIGDPWWAAASITESGHQLL